MRTIMHGFRAVAASAALLTAAGCAQMATLDDILGGVGMGGQGLTGEVQYVGPDQLEVRTAEGRTERVYHDRNTRVVYQNREYAVSALERGDVVRVAVQQGSRGEAYAQTIEVQQSVQDRGGVAGTNRLEVLDGTVRRVDHQRGQFELTDSYRRSVLVTLPYSTARADVDRFHRLREGDRVRVEVEMVSEGRAELVRFR